MKIIPNFCFLLIAVLTLSPAWAAQPKYKNLLRVRGQFVRYG